MMHSWLFLAVVACGEPQTAAVAEGHGEDHGEEAAHEGEASHEGEADKAGEGEAPATAARVFFVSPKDGDTVSSPVKIEMGIEGMEVRPAGELAENTGHHHVIVGPAGVAEGTQVPKDEKHIHFGKGQTEAELELPPGEHKLTLQFADGNHVSFGEPLSATISITVE